MTAGAAVDQAAGRGRERNEAQVVRIGRRGDGDNQRCGWIRRIVQQLERNRIGWIAGKRIRISRVPQRHRHAADRRCVARIGSAERGGGVEVAGIGQNGVAVTVL